MKILKNIGCFVAIALVAFVTQLLVLLIVSAILTLIENTFIARIIVELRISWLVYWLLYCIPPISAFFASSAVAEKLDAMKVYIVLCVAVIILQIIALIINLISGGSIRENICTILFFGLNGIVEAKKQINGIY